MRSKLDAVLQAVNQVILGKEPQVRLALACLLARGHLLIEVLPGMGKTTLSHALARVFAEFRDACIFHENLLFMRMRQAATLAGYPLVPV